jgi:hypothetical protein
MRRRSSPRLRDQNVVTTEYFFVLDDSWLCYDRGQIAESMALMEKDPNLLQVYCWDGPAKNNMLINT